MTGKFSRQKFQLFFYNFFRQEYTSLLKEKNGSKLEGNTIEQLNVSKNPSCTNESLREEI